MKSEVIDSQGGILTVDNLEEAYLIGESALDDVVESYSIDVEDDLVVLSFIINDGRTLKFAVIEEEDTYGDIEGIGAEDVLSPEEMGRFKTIEPERKQLQPEVEENVLENEILYTKSHPQLDKYFKRNQFYEIVGPRDDGKIGIRTDSGKVLYVNENVIQQYFDEGVAEIMEEGIGGGIEEPLPTIEY